MQRKAPPQEEAQPSTSWQIDTSVTYKMQHTMDSLTKEMDMALKAKTNAEVALSVLKDKL